MAKLEDVAREAGVSIASASYALSGGKPVSAALRRRVLDAATRVGYVPHRQARTLRTGRSQTFGVVLPDLVNPFFTALLQAIERAARESGYGTLVAGGGGDGASEAAALDLLAEHRVDGLVWVPAGDPGAIPQVPTVTVDRAAPDCDGVAADHDEAGRLVARHLRGAGRRRPVVLHGPSDVPTARARSRGFRDAWTGEIAFEAEVPFDHRIPAAVVRRLADAEADYDAVACANDAVALGVLRTLQRSGRRVPTQVAVVGVDDIAFAELAEPPLTTVRQPVDALGAEAVRLLTDRLAGVGGPARRVTLPVRLVVRASSPASPAGAARTDGGPGARWAAR
ncbi:MAG: LacI family DNA-binding transcriptional regulator [Trueperaceae bacterium]|nr:LacI family DNA-binding transcriptional regulator [Trueperaceae bacterium]